MRRILMDMKKWMRCAAAVVLSVLVAFSATACSQPANIESGAVSQEYPVTVNEVTLNAKPQKVAVLSGSLADVVLAMGYETSLSLASDDCTQPDLQVLPKVSATDAQSVISAGVDLVLAETMDDSEKQTLENAGITVLLLTRAKNREDFERLYAQVGTALNGGSTGYNVGVKAAQKIFSSLDDLSRLAPESNTVVTACYISDVNGSAVTGDELGSVMMSYIGLTNIFKGLTGGTFTFDDLRLSDPTMIFCSEDVRGQIMQDAQYANLSAVKNGRVYAVDPNYMNWQGKTVYNACIDMMGLAYPELTEENSAALELDSELSETEATASPSPAPEYTAIKSGTGGRRCVRDAAALSGAWLSDGGIHRHVWRSDDGGRKGVPERERAYGDRRSRCRDADGALFRGGKSRRRCGSHGDAGAGIGNEYSGGHRDNTRRCVKFESLKGRLCRPFLY